MYSFAEGKTKFDEYLSSKGLSSEQGKHTIVKYKEVPPYYVSNGTPAHEELVNPSKIVGFSREEVVLGESIFDNLFNLCTNKYESLFSIMEERSVKDFVHFFSEDQSTSISAAHLLDTDEYIVGNDGNHRASLAACLGISKINIKYVHEFICNYDLKEKYDMETTLLNAFNISELKSDNSLLHIYFLYNGEERYVSTLLTAVIVSTFEESLYKFNAFMTSVIKTDRFLSKCPSWLKKIYIQIKKPYQISKVPPKLLFSLQTPFSFFEWFCLYKNI